LWFGVFSGSLIPRRSDLAPTGALQISSSTTDSCFSLRESLVPDLDFPLRRSAAKASSCPFHFLQWSSIRSPSYSVFSLPWIFFDCSRCRASVSIVWNLQPALFSTSSTRWIGFLVPRSGLPLSTSLFGPLLPLVLRLVSSCEHARLSDRCA
jgi:hypothetical protein